MKNTSGVSLAAGGSTPNERFQIANIISFAQSRIFDAPSVFDAILRDVTGARKPSMRQASSTLSCYAYFLIYFRNLSNSN